MIRSILDLSRIPQTVQLLVGAENNRTQANKQANKIFALMSYVYIALSQDVNLSLCLYYIKC